MEQANLDLGLFKDTKVMDQIYTRSSVMYRAIVLEAPIKHHGGGGVVVFYRYMPHFQVETIQTHRTNVECFQLVSGGRRWFIVGCYIKPNYIATTENVAAAISQFPLKISLYCVLEAILLRVGG